MNEMVNICAYSVDSFSDRIYSSRGITTKEVIFHIEKDAARFASEWP